MVTVNREDYLRALYILEEKKLPLRTTELANYLKISKASVSEMANKLADKKLIVHKRYGNLEFTDEGKKLAINLTARHRIIELFLKNILKINPNNLHEEAHRLEHAFSDESISKLRELLGNPTKDPHGEPIPT